MDYLIWLIIPAAILAFVGIWCFVCLLISLISGWRKLAKQYETHRKPEGGRIFGGLYARLNSAQYKHMLTVGATPQGLYLSVVSFFRPGHPPLLIDWSAVGPVTAGKSLWMDTWTFSIRVDGSTSVNLMLVKREVVEEIEKYSG